MKPPRLSHVPALDGLRGLAVLSVLAFHAGTPLVGGYLGVDLFFVLSGFLITSLLIAERQSSGRIDLRAFWIRRARRLFPALLSLMPALALYSRFLVAPGERASLRRSALATLAYVANWSEIFSHRQYWDLFRAPSPLEHTWSLAIEEQFYLVWPLVVVAVFAVAKNATRALWLLCLALGGVSAALLVRFYAHDTMRAYFGTDARGAAIVAGCALAAALAPLRPLASRAGVRALDLAGALALAVLGWAWRTLDGQNPFLYHGGFWITELAALVLIACSVQGDPSWVARALSLPPLRAVGNISYGLYLWHWPVFVVLNERRAHVQSAAALLGVRFAVTFAIAGISYLWLEQPIRRRGVRGGVPTALVSLAAAVALVIVSTRSRRSPAAEAPPAGADVRALPPSTQLPPRTLRLLVVGDSVANRFGKNLRGVQSGGSAFVAARGRDDCSILEGVVLVHSLSGTPHAGGNCGADWNADVAALQPDATLVILGGGYFAPAQIDGAWQLPGDPGWQRVYQAELTRRLRALYPNGGKIFVARVPEPIDFWSRLTSTRRIDAFNRTVEDAARDAHASIIDLPALLCPDQKCQTQSHGAPIRPDGLHLEGPGADELARTVLAEIRQATVR